MKRASSPKPAASKAGAKAPASATTSGAAGIDAALVRELAQVLGDTNLTEIEVSRGDLHIRVARQVVAAPANYAVAAPMAPAPTPLAAPASSPTPASSPKASLADHPGVVASPMVGTAYGRPNPQAKPFVEVGSKVAAGEKVFLVEAMKTFNEVVAHKAGVVSQILVEDGQPVEFGQPMLVID